MASIPTVLDIPGIAASATVSVVSLNDEPSDRGNSVCSISDISEEQEVERR